MPGAISDPRQMEDRIVEVDMSATTNTATRGDYISFSGKAAVANFTARPAAAYFPHSGIGIAIDQNPVWVGPDQSASANGKLRVARGGIFRVSAVPSPTGAYSAGLFCFPVSTGSGIVGQTGRTGAAALWSATATIGGLLSAITAIIVSASAAGVAVTTGTAYYERYTVDPTSAVGQIVRVISNASGATGQWDIVLFPPTLLNAPYVNR